MPPPSVDALARSLADTGLPHPLLVHAARAAIAAGDPASARIRADQLRVRMLQPVINATGVLLHTNLGRAPVAHAQDASYSNLELDLRTGSRGSRQASVGTLLAEACGAEAATIVNNGAAAVLLVLASLAKGRSVAVSRSEMVEIGGGFRIPEVMSQSGAQLLEVGTTNRTRAADYRAAVDDPSGAVALLLRVHQSNYRIVGFTEAPALRDLVSIGPPVVVDLGSGLLDAACPWLAGGPPRWLRDEPAVRQTLETGAALVTFSGDKLLGGPQAGIIAGRADLVRACEAHPLARALRPGGLVLNALQQTVLAYLRRDGDAVPFWRMAAVSSDTLRARAEQLRVPDKVKVVDTASVAGGGTLPGVEIASAGLSVPGDLTSELRSATPPVIARVHEDHTVLDLRTVDPGDDPLVEAALASLPPL